MEGGKEGMMDGMRKWSLESSTHWDVTTPSHGYTSRILDYSYYWGIDDIPKNILFDTLITLFFKNAYRPLM